MPHQKWVATSFASCSDSEVAGTPEEVAQVIESYIGHDLKQLLNRRGGAARSGKAASGAMD